MRSLLPNPKHTAPPERPRAVPQQRPSRPVGIGGTVIAELIAGDGPNTAPIPLTDWSARLADDWAHIDARWDNATKALAREFINFRFAVEYTPRATIAPLLSHLVELRTVQLPDWRQALTVHAEAELALYAAELKAQVA